MEFTRRIFALHDRGMILSAPEQSEIGRLMGPFISQWKEYHRASGHEPPEARLTSMSQTFSQLRDIIRQIHSRDVEFVPLDLSEAESNPQIRDDLSIFARWDNPSDEDK